MRPSSESGPSSSSLALEPSPMSPLPHDLSTDLPDFDLFFNEPHEPRDPSDPLDPFDQPLINMT